MRRPSGIAKDHARGRMLLMVLSAVALVLGGLCSPGC